jgi:hypothetical protein
MNLFGGKRGLLENSENLCTTRPRAEIRLKAQNGRSKVTRPRLGVRCGKR